MKKIAVITGASSGMGREFAYRLSAEDVDELWLIARRAERLEEVATEIFKKTGKHSKVIPLDLAEQSSYAAFEEMLGNEALDVRFFVHASGFGKYGTYKDLTPAEINSMIDVNMRATVFMTYAALKHMNKGGRVILLGSASAFQPLPYFNLYASTKAFVVHFSRALNVELKEREISVTAVCPGYVRTEFIDVAKNTHNPDTCNNFTPLYEAADVVEKAVKDSKKGKDLSVLGFVSKFRRVGAKLIPTRLTMKVWLKIK